VTHLLLIDDETATRLVMASRLKEAGFEVTQAESGAQGIALSREKRFDLLIVDATLKSGIGGVEVVRRLRQIPRNFGVPIVLAGKGANREEFTAAYEAGADACLLKSDLPVLEHVLKVFLRKKAELDEVLATQRTLAEQNRRMQAERSNAAPEPARPSRKSAAEPAAAPITARPDGMLVVDDEGLVLSADRGAADLFGVEVEGRGLGKLAPATGLEAFARDANVDPRDGLRFDLPARSGRAARAVLASVVPLSARPGENLGDKRVVLLVDLAQRKLSTESARLAEYTLPRQQLPALLEVARVAYGMSSLVGSSPAMARIRGEVRELCNSAEPVLLVGESGSGREHIARALHFCGDLSGQPFLAVACSQLSPENLEVELFGAIKGAIEGVSERPGALQLGKGTVFVEDIESLPLPLQKKLLRAVREGVVTRAGTERTEPTEMRIVASTKVDLNQAVAAGKFDVELLRALAANVIVVPPLRERPEDLEPLVDHILRLAGAGRARLELAPAALERLRAHRWPGNVGELKSALERAARRTEGATIEVEHLPAVLREGEGAADDVELTPVRASKATARAAAAAVAAAAVGAPQLVPAAAPAGAFGQRPGEIGADDPISLDHYERKCLERALAATGNDKLKAAKLLKVGKSTLYRKLKRYEIA
jgi:DNA-binding NtrC family response regulator